MRSASLRQSQWREPGVGVVRICIWAGPCPIAGLPGRTMDNLKRALLAMQNLSCPVHVDMHVSLASLDRDIIDGFVSEPRHDPELPAVTATILLKPCGIQGSPQRRQEPKP
jgi:hypothetical protein